MIATRFILLLTFLFISSTHGLKGARIGSFRQLQTQVEPKGVDETAPKADKAVGKTDDKADDKADKKTDTKTDKKTDKKDDKKDKKSDKKCKKRPSKKEKGTLEPNVSTEEVSLETKQGLPETVETPKPEEAEDYCEDSSIKKSGDCNQLRSGVFPQKSNTMDGKLVLEIAPKNKTLSEMQQVLEDETTLKAVGCEKRRLQDVFDEVTDSNSTEAEISLLAFEIGELIESNEECSNSQRENDTDCSHLTSSVIVHFSGNATEEQQYALFDTLTNTLQDQVASGVFAEYAEIYYADVIPGDNVTEEGINSSGKAGNSGGSSIGGIAGGVVAAIVVAAVAAFVYIKKPFANMESCGPSAVGPVDGQVEHVLSDDNAEPVAVRVF